MKAAALMGVCASLAMAQTESFRLIPADAPIVIGVRVSGVMQSPAGAEIRKQIQEQVGKTPAAGMSGMILGMLDAVDSVVVTSSSADVFMAATGSGARNAATTPMLVVINGRFESFGLPALLQSQSKAQPELYKGVSIFRTDAANVDKNRLALLDPNTVLIGDRKELTGAIDRARGAQPEAVPSPRLTALAQNDFFVSMEMPASAKPMTDPKNPATQMLKDVTGLDLGVIARSGMNIAIDLRTTSAPAAERMATQVQALMALGAMQMNDQPEVAKLVQRITVKPEASGIRMALALTEAEVMELAKAAQERASAPAGQSKPVRQGPPVIDGLGTQAEIKTEKPQPATGGIKISGLDPEPKKE